MPKIQLIGRILPATAILNTNDLPTTNWKSPELGLDMTFAVRINNSTISVDCEINKWIKDDHIMAVYMRALDIARAIVDLASFQNAIGMTVVFETLVEPNGARSQLLFHQPELSVLSTAIQNATAPINAEDNNFDKVLRFVLTDVSLFRSLHELIEAITQTHGSVRSRHGRT
jgi:hypothetical protein